MPQPHFPGGVYCIDFEYRPQGGVDGNTLDVICLVVLELGSGVVRRYWRDELLQMQSAPFATDATALVMAYNAPAETACFGALGWAPPQNILDLYAEFRNLTNAKELPAGKGLLGALIYFGAPAMAATQKELMRDLILGGGPWSQAQEYAIAAYCEADVMALRDLYACMQNLIDWPRALLRGQYAVAVAASESIGIPVDAELYDLLRQQTPQLRSQLIALVDADFAVYDNGHFKEEWFARYLMAQQMRWPLHPSGRPKLDDATFKDMSKTYPQVEPMRQLRKTLVQWRDLKLAIGHDGRNRFPLFAYSSQTGRNQPSSSRCIFGLVSWLRGLVRPEPGMALAYVDWSQQELAIAAALSGDKAMQKAYQSGDFYLTFAIMAGAAPAHATKDSHPEVRERFKVCALGVLFGLGEQGLALKLGISDAQAGHLMQAHKRTFSVFWDWSQKIADHAMLTGSLQTLFGWTLHVGRHANVRSLKNFPMQANGAEMMRLAHMELVRRGIRVCTPVHDALLVEAQQEEIDAVVRTTQDVMRQASAIVLNGFEVRSEARVVRYPDRFLEPKGVPMWNRVMTLLGREDALVGAVL